MRALIAIGRIYNGELPDEVSAGRSLYQRGAIRFLPGAATVPLVIDHTDERQIGVVRELVEIQDTDGPWLASRCEVTDPPEWLKGGMYGSKASFGFQNLHSRQFGEGEHVLRGILDEVSVLLRQRPVEPRAHVLGLRTRRGT